MGFNRLMMWSNFGGRSAGRGGFSGIVFRGGNQEIGGDNQEEFVL